MPPDQQSQPARSSPHSLRSRLGSVRIALAGWASVLRTEPNARVHAVATALVIGLAVWLRLPAAETALLAFAIGIVWVAELLNTAIEDAVDLASPERDPVAGRAKDLAAGAVLAAAATAATVGLLVLGPPLLVAVGLR